MNIIYSKILAYILTIVTLFSSSFITINEHFCNGDLESISFFGKPDVCDMLTCKSHGLNKSISEDNCCSNIQTEDNCCTNNRISKGIYTFILALETSYNVIDFEKILNTSFYNLIKLSNLAKIPLNFKDYSPPLITKDILTFVQCFRI